MSWKPLPKGEFTGIDWSAPGAIDGMDPYLAWAEADGFMGYHVHGREPEKLKWLPIVIGLLHEHGRRCRRRRCWKASTLKSCTRAS